MLVKIIHYVVWALWMDLGQPKCLERVLEWCVKHRQDL